MNEVWTYQVPFVALMVLSPLVFAWGVARRALAGAGADERIGELRRLIAPRLRRLTWATAVAVAVCFVLLFWRGPESGESAARFLPRFAFVAFHALWWPFGMRVVVGVDREGRRLGILPEARKGRSARGGVRAASLRPRRVSDYLGPFLRHTPWILGVAGVTWIAGRWIWLAERGVELDGLRLILPVCLFGAGGLSFLLTYAVWIDREVLDPHEIAGLGDGAREYEQEVDGLRRFRVRGIAVLQLSAAVLFLGLSALWLELGRSSDSGAMLGLIGGLAGGSVGILGALFGTLASLRAWRLQMLRKRIEDAQAEAGALGDAR